MRVDDKALSALAALRAELYRAVHACRDALFELIDATAGAGAVPSLAHLSVAPGHRRGHGSVYAAVRRGTLHADRLRAALCRSPLAQGLPADAVDVSVVPRGDAECSPERGYDYHASRHSAGKPIVAGWAYQWVAQLGAERSSWTAPIDARRLRPGERAEAAAAEQIRALLPLLPAEPIPLFVCDAGYDAAALTRALDGERAAVLVRLRDDRVFFFDPPPPSGKPGRPRRHGPRFSCADPTTWPAPTLAWATADPACGSVSVRVWTGLHGRPARKRSDDAPPPRGAVVRVVLAHLPTRRRPPEPLWLWYAGPAPPDPDLLWRAYAHRFDLEHTLRFCKERLGWDRARPRTPAQMDRWTWIVLAAYAQLRLARPLVTDRRLPWEKRLPPAASTPLRVQRGFGALVAALGTPASAPKPCGRSPGRPKGRRSAPAPRTPAVKSAA
jgi:DDE superfamily endonuclease